MVKEQIEKKLKELLNELLESGNQDGSILKLEYLPVTKDSGKCVVELTVFIDENGIPTFQGY